MDTQERPCGVETEIGVRWVPGRECPAFPLHASLRRGLEGCPEAPREQPATACARAPGRHNSGGQAAAVPSPSLWRFGMVAEEGCIWEVGRKLRPGPSQQGATCVDLGVQPTGAETRRPGSSPSPSPLEGPLFLHPSLPSPSVHAGRPCCSCGPASPAAIAGRRPGAACGAVGGTECRRLRDAGVLAFPG